jgi:DNA-directed RNA polymerase subunit RPC12/RpoP
MAAVVAVFFAFFGLLAFYDGASAYVHAEVLPQQIYGVCALILSAGCFGVATLASIGSSAERIRKSTAEAVELLKGIRERQAREEADAAGLIMPTPAPPSTLPPAIAIAEEPRLRVKCSKCGKVVAAKMDWAGKSGKCPGCGASVMFPANADPARILAG